MFYFTVIKITQDNSLIARSSNSLLEIADFMQQNPICDCRFEFPVRAHWIIPKEFMFRRKDIVFYLWQQTGNSIYILETNGKIYYCKNSGDLFSMRLHFKNENYKVTSVLSGEVIKCNNKQSFNWKKEGF